MPTFATTLITVFCQSSELKSLTWQNKEPNNTPSVDLIQPLNLYLKLKIFLKNIVESRRVFTLLITTHYM